MGQLTTTRPSAGAAGSRRRPSRLIRVGLLADLLAVLACGVYAGRGVMGMDIEFDLLSYHDVYAWAFVHDAYHLFWPDPFQNHYLNPLGEVPWYITDQLLDPRGSTIAIALIAGLNLPLIRRITRDLVVDRIGELGALALGVAAMALAMTGATFKAELGTSLSDVVVSLPALGGILAIIKATRRRQHAGRLLALGGLGLGVAFGIKLTMTPYVVGGAVAALLLCVVWRSVRPLLALVLGGLAGTLVGGGWWLAYIWAQTGNPVFPYYNAVFRAPGYPAIDLRDTRFGAHGIGDALRYPLYLWHGTTRVLDVPVRDARWLVLVVLLAVAVLLIGLRALRSRHWPLPLPVTVFGVLFVVPALVWLAQFGIARYGVTTELLTGPAFVLGGLAVLGTLTRIGPARVVAVTCAGLVGAVLLSQYTYGHYHHVPFAASRFQIDARPLRAIPADSTVIADNTWAASGFLLPELPSTVRRHIVHGWFWGTPMLTGELGAQLSHSPHLYVLEPPSVVGSRTAGRLLAEYLGLRADWGRCVLVHAVQDRSLCPATYVGATYHGLPPFLTGATP